MKRPGHDVAGRPRVCDPEPDVAGRPISSNAIGRTSFGDVLHILRSSRTDDAELIEDFADFLARDEDCRAEELPAADALFSERLRRRLWKNFVISQLRNVGKETH